MNLLKRNVAGWNQWRKENPEVKPNIYLGSRGDVTLRNENLRGADLSNVNFYWGTDMTGADLQGSNLSNSIIPNVDFSRANLTGANFRNTILDATVFAEANLSSADFAGAILKEVNFGRANLAEVKLTRTTHNRTDFRNANLSSADFCGAILQSASFCHANLCRADLSHTVHDCTSYLESDLRIANLKGMREVNLSRLDCRGTPLHTVFELSSCERLRLFGFLSREDARNGVIPEEVIKEVTLADSIREADSVSAHRCCFGRARLTGTRFDLKFVFFGLLRGQVKWWQFFVQPMPNRESRA